MCIRDSHYTMRSHRHPSAADLESGFRSSQTAARLERVRTRMALARSASSIRAHGGSEDNVVSSSSSDYETRLLLPSPGTTMARLRAGMPLRPPVLQRIYKPPPKPEPEVREKVVVVPVHVPTPWPVSPPLIVGPGPMDRLETVVSQIMSTRPPMPAQYPQTYPASISPGYY
eukprot:TRINITY_DN16327_c0_g1_i1.p1 TRINITY_DN16327_c0_g1~~TRINITY_DN16327_c0_g1_i1.p1  ORF type:complete len:172 (-),score=20.15 TRINITY_DN16327_c0_g1_i1:317-832(-)